MPFQKILVYVDGRPASERALCVAAAVAARSGGRLHLLHVAEPPLEVPELGPSVVEALASGQVEELDRLRTHAQRMGVAADCEARTGSPFVEIIRAAQREKCDLVVKAAMGRGRLGWPLLGSTALHLVRKCPVPVWLVGTQRDPLPRRILALLASDGASEARQALDRRVLEIAIALASVAGAELRVGAAWDAPGETLLRRRMSEEKLRDYVEGARRQAEDGLGRVLAPLADAINPARVHLVRGVPWVELVQLAATRADLVVIGTTPPSAGAAFLIREEAEEVIHRLDASIVAVKPDDFTSPVTAA